MCVFPLKIFQEGRKRLNVILGRMGRLAAEQIESHCFSGEQVGAEQFMPHVWSPREFQILGGGRSDSRYSVPGLEPGSPDCSLRPSVFGILLIMTMVFGDLVMGPIRWVS